MGEGAFGSIDPAGLVLGTISVLQGTADSKGGVSFYSGIATYTPTSGPVQGQTVETPAVSVGVISAGIILAPFDMGAAVFHLHAQLGNTPTGPYIANARFKQESESGFDEIELDVKFEPLPTPVGTWDNPWVEFDSLVNIKIDGYDDAKMTFVTSVSKTGSVYCTTPEFVYGQADFNWGGTTFLEINYHSSTHG